MTNDRDAVMSYGEVYLYLLCNANSGQYFDACRLLNSKTPIRNVDATTSSLVYNSKQDKLRHVDVNCGTYV